MFTIKLFKKDFQLVLSALQYEKQDRYCDMQPSCAVGATIIANGTEYHIGRGFRPPEEETFESAFIENAAGKTIDAIYARPRQMMAAESGHAG